MADHRFTYPIVREIPSTRLHEEPPRRFVRRSQRDLVMASLLRRQADEIR